jgi:hypothetical protein
MAQKKDPTVTSAISANAPEGVEPAPPVSEADNSADEMVYKDMPAQDKPDKTTVAQVQVRPEEQ